jgi:hypothetical protein
VTSPLTGASRPRSAGGPNPDLESDFDRRSVFAQLHDITGTQVHGSIDASAVEECPVSAREVEDQKSDVAVVARDNAGVMASNACVSLQVEPHGGRWRTPQDQFTVRAKRNHVYLGRAGAAQMSDNEMDHTSKSAKCAAAGSRRWR